MSKNKKVTIYVFTLLALIISNTTKSVAQENQELRVKDLQVPVSPVINLLGVSPIEVSEPTAPKSFGFTALESTTNSQGDILNNYAVEFAPYWWFSHPTLNIIKYFENDGFGEAFLQNLSFSVGVTNTDLTVEGQEVDGSRVGVGARSSLLAGKINPLMITKLQEYYDLSVVCDREPEIPIKTISDSEDLIIEEIEDCSVREKELEVIKEIEELSRDRVGWQMDIANAYIFDAPENNVDDLDLSRIGVWLTTSYTGVGVDEAVSKLGSEICKNEIISVLSEAENSIISDFSIENILAKSNNYQCTRRPKLNEIAPSRILFYDKEQETKSCVTNKFSINISDLKSSKINIDNFKNDYFCFNQSGLSDLKIIDNPNLESQDTKYQKTINACTKGIDKTKSNIPSLLDSQESFQSLFRDINNENSLVSDFKPQRYLCSILTTTVNTRIESKKAYKPIITNADAEIVVIDTPTDNPPESSEQESLKITECKNIINNFLKNQNLKFNNQYACAEFSWPDFEIAIKNIDEETISKKCREKIKEKDDSELRFLNYECALKPKQFSFLGISRYIRDEFSGEKEDNFDIGARILWRSATESRLQLSAEYLRRFGGEDDDRLVAGARYRITDTYEVFTSVGKAFDDGFEENNLITIFGLNIGLGNNPMAEVESPGQN